MSLATVVELSTNEYQLYQLVRARLGLYAVSELGLVLTGENPYFVVTPLNQVVLIRDWAKKCGVSHTLPHKND